MLEEPVDDGEPQPFKMAKWAYKACMDEEEIKVFKKNQSAKKLIGFFQKVGMAPLHFFRDKLLPKVGGWPLIAGDSWKEEDFTW